MENNNKPGLSDTSRGLLAAFFAYLLWGAFPLYMKAVSYMGVMEVVAHRILWSVPTAGIILILLKRIPDLKRALRDGRMILLACLTSSLVTVNWSLYVWAIMNDHALDASLGYYINPLLNVLLAAVFLKEKLTTAQWVAVGFAVMAVVILSIGAGGLPWVSLILPISFSLYGLIRKKMPIGPAQGFMLEAMILFIPALIFATYITINGTDHFVHGTMVDRAWLILAGPATAIPLILFATGAKLLNYATLGLMQYLTPTFVFFIAVFYFGEPFAVVNFVAFALIWCGLVIYTVSSLRQYKRRKAV